jgi:hypothetical protein
MKENLRVITLELINYIDDSVRVEVSKLEKASSNDIHYNGYFRVSQVRNLELLLFKTRKRIRELKKGVMYFNKDYDNNTKEFSIHQKLELLGDFIYSKIDHSLNELNQEDRLAGIIKIKSEEWIIQTVILNANFCFLDDLQTVYDNLMHRHEDKSNVYLAMQRQAEIETKKLVWKGTLSQLGYIFANLANFDFIERPKKINHTDDLEKFSNILLETFKVEGTPNALKQFLGGKAKRTANSFDKEVKKIYSNNDCLKAPFNKEILYIPNQTSLS